MHALAALVLLLAQTGAGKVTGKVTLSGLAPKPLKDPGVLRITCDVHPWMRAWVHVLATSAYAVTDESGAYTISGVPPGKHTLNLWHERLGEKEQQVEVPSAGAATANLQLTPK